MFSYSLGCATAPSSCQTKNETSYHHCPDLALVLQTKLRINAAKQNPQEVFSLLLRELRWSFMMCSQVSAQERVRFSETTSPAQFTSAQ